MRYVSAVFLAFLVWVLAFVLIGTCFGQTFAGISGASQLGPTIATWATSLGLAALAFKKSLRDSDKVLRHKRTQAGLCPECGYDLRAHEFGQKCPECGTPIPPRPASR